MKDDEKETADNKPQKRFSKGSIIAFTGGGLAGALVGLLLGVVLTAAVWVFGFVMLLAAPPLELLDDLFNTVLVITLLLLIGLPILGALAGGGVASLLSVIWRGLTQGEVRLPDETADPPLLSPHTDPSPGPAIPSSSPSRDARMPPGPSVDPRPKQPFPTRALLKSVGVWLGIVVALAVVGIFASALVDGIGQGVDGRQVAILGLPLDDYLQTVVWILFFGGILIGHLLAVWPAFGVLLPGIGLVGWWQGKMRWSETAAPLLLPAFLFGAAIWLAIYLATLLLGGFLINNDAPSGGLSLALLCGLGLGPLLGVGLAAVSYRRNSYRIFPA